jgi:hypothetical protein
MKASRARNPGDAAAEFAFSAQRLFQESLNHRRLLFPAWIR